MSGQFLTQEEIDRTTSLCATSDICKTGTSETQIWGLPWSEDDFVKQMVKFGHPARLQSSLPDVLKDTVEVYMKADEMEMKRAMDPEVALVLAPKNVCLWEAMLKSVQYPDLGVVDEFKQGSELVGCVDRTGLWPMKFQPAAISVSELHEIAKKERGLLRQQFHAEGDPDLTEEVCRTA